VKILVDMNLSPEWLKVLESHTIEALHWYSVGNPQAKDSEIMEWARSNGYIVFTHDLDFGQILAHTRSRGPSVIQVRSQEITTSSMQTILLAALRQFSAELAKGCIITIDEHSSRVRLLPIH
jgi:predicted nuclease of predicted toxin-antitoxin system